MSATNAWADNLSRVTDNSDWQMEWGPHTIDHFASNAKKQLPR